MPDLNHHIETAVPRVVSYADHTIITPPNRLRHAITNAGADDIDDAVGRAEKALAALSEKFSVWMQAEWARLAFAHAEIVADGFTIEATARLLQIAHDIRGNAPLYGYGLAAEIAASLCRLVECSPSRQAICRALVGRHVDAIGAAARSASDASVISTLGSAVTHHLLRESSAAIAAPSLAPA